LRQRRGSVWRGCGGACADGGGHHLVHGAGLGAHLTPAVSIAFALRGDFPWKRVPAYIVAQLIGAILATLLLWALLSKQDDARLTLPRAGVSTTTAILWELIPITAW
jgi:aquaporin Z